MRKSIPLAWRSESLLYAQLTFRCVRDFLSTVTDLATIAGFALPDDLNSGPTWFKAEAGIEAAVKNNDVELTKERCDAYRDRVLKFCKAWLAKIEEHKAKAA
jgi:hypothetical protein